MIYILNYIFISKTELVFYNAFMYVCCIVSVKKKKRKNKCPGLKPGEMRKRGDLSP